MTRANLAAIRRTTSVAWPAHEKVDAKAHLIATARRGHAEIMSDAVARSGTRPDFDAYANSPGRPVEAVVLPGPIVYRYRYLREAVLFALDELRKASPVVSGAYVQSHTLYVNGVETDVIPNTLRPGDEIFIANPVPYARRLEIGKTKSGRSFVLQVPPRIYETVAKKIVAGRYRNIARVRFGYVNVPNAHVIRGRLSSHYATGAVAGPRGGGTLRKRRQQVGKAVMAPAIFFEALT